MSDIEQALRTTRPLKVVALLDDDREVPIAIPRGTRRWERMAATLDSQPWVEVRLLDKAGALMAPPLVRASGDPRIAQPAPQLDDISGSSKDRQVDATLVERLLRGNTEHLVRGFTEVARIMRSSGSAEVTAALQANRETVSAMQLVVTDLREQLDEARQRIHELEVELAARMSEDEKPKQEPEKSAGEKFLDQMAEGFLAGNSGGSAGERAQANKAG